jgi:GT2 family glycosyltransferase
MIIVRIITHFVKFVLIGYLILFGASNFDESKPIYLQNILFWLLIFLPCIGAYEYIISSTLKKVFSKEIEQSKKPKETFKEKLEKLMNESKNNKNEKQL